MLKTVATRCEALRRKCTKLDLGQGSTPGLAGGAYSASGQNPRLDFRGERGRKDRERV